MEVNIVNRNNVLKLILYVFGIGLSLYLSGYFKMSNTNDSTKLFEEFMEWRLEDSPEFSTCIGIHKYDDKLEHYSEKSYAQRKVTCEGFFNRAEILEKDALGENLQNLQLFKFDLKTEIDGLKYYRYAAPLNYFEGPHIEILQLVSYMEKETVEDFKKIIARYNEFSRQADEMIDMMKQSISEKTTNHKSSMTGILAQLNALIVPIEESEFYKPFLSIPSTIKLEKELLQNEAKNAISNNLLPAFQKLALFIEQKYLPATRPKIAATSLPDGQNFYKACLKFHLSYDLTPSQVHQMGLKEVERISKEMGKIIKDLNLNLTIQEFSNQIRNDPLLFYTDKEELLQGYREIIKADIIPTIKNIFDSIPQAELEIQPLASSQAAGPLAYYLAGSFDGKRPGKFYVNAANLKNAPKYEMMSLALHEGLPGHHLQSSFLIELPNVPRFRQIMEDRKYFSVPARFPIHTAYVEGWGLYSEYLGNELGLYKDPYTLFGRLSQEIFRACRLVVDTGIHAFGWSIEQAVNYMLENSATVKENIEKEINRYIMWPGQACAYKVGEIKIKELRQRAENKLGNKFDLKEFHDLILRSVGAMSHLEEQVDGFIAGKLFK